MLWTTGPAGSARAGGPTLLGPQTYRTKGWRSLTHPDRLTYARSDTPTRFRAQSSSILPFISGLRRKGRLDLYSVTHWTKKRFTVTRRTPRRIRPAVRTAWTELQAGRKVLVLNEKQRTANQSNGLIFYQVVATGFEPATSRSRTRRSHN